MKPFMSKLLTDPRYKLARVETQFGYFSSRFGLVGVPYKGIYGKGYRVYVEDKSKRQGGKTKMTIYYFIEREDYEEENN